MPVDDELNIETNPDLDQHFLSNPAKLALVIEAAGIRPTDRVVEVGAGIGTVAEQVPSCQSLTVIEYDAKLTPNLRRRVPHARVIQGDALTMLPTVRCDVLLSNLPAKLTATLAELLPRLEFRVALITVASIDELSSRNEISYPPGGTSEPLSCDDANSAGFVVPFQLLTSLENSFVLETITILEPADFRPRQAARAEVVRVRRAETR